MLSSRRISLALGAVCLLLSAFASTALAAGPATVTVRVQGFNGATVLPQTQVTTNTTAIPIEGGSCSGTSAGGALYDATHGDWQVKYGGEGVEIDGIDGLNFRSFAENPGVYWAFWLNDEFAHQGACREEVSSGADIVFVAQCYEAGGECQSATAPNHFLTSTAPTSSNVNVGEAVSVTVGSLDTESGAREASLPENVTVTAGSVSVSPGAGGVATLSFATPGSYTLQAQAPDSVPSDPYTICVHHGNDGTCGTTASSSSTSSTTGAASGSVGVAGFSQSAPYTGPYALVADASGLLNGHTYGRGRAPRVLAGSILAHSAVSSISLKLRREYRGRCYAYNGTKERFVAARCGEGSFFKVSSDGSYSYLLPAALAPGRYVLDIQATDAAGNRTTLARGTSRIVFHVR